MILVVWTGALTSFEQRLSDAWFGVASIAPSGRTILVTVDAAAARRDSGVRLPRRDLAELLLKLDAAGASRILIELGLADQTNDSDDEFLERALAGLGPKIAISRMAIVSGNGERGRWRRTEVNERFARHATMVASDLALDHDAQLRKVGIEGSSLPRLVPSAVWLSGAYDRGDPFRIDFGIDLDGVPVVDADALLRGISQPNQFLGSHVIIGSYSSPTGYGIGVPRYGDLRRPQVTALATETLSLGRKMQAIPLITSNMGVVVLAVLVALWCARLNGVVGAGVLVGVALCGIGFGARLQAEAGLILPTASIVVAAFIGFTAAQAAVHPALEPLRHALGAVLKGIDLRLVSVLDDTSDGLLTFDSKGTLLSINSAARHLLGLDVIDRPQEGQLSEVLGPQAGAVLAVIRDRQPKRLRTTTLASGARRWLELAINAVPVDESWIGVATVRDVTEQQAQVEALSRIATQDALTGLLNRRAFEDALEAAYADGAPRCALLLCDLDGFKQINDSLGHQAGDLVLQEVAARLTKEAGRNDVVARLGGDEFVVLIPHATEILAAQTAHRLVGAISQPFEIGERRAAVGVSIGVALGSAHDNPQALLDGADRAMYRAKSARSGHSFTRKSAAA